MSVQAIAWAMAQQIDRPGPKLLLICMANYANRAGYCWPSHETLMRNSSLKDRAAREHMRWLEREGFLERQRRYDKEGNRLCDGLQLLMELVAKDATSTDAQEGQSSDNVDALVANSASSDDDQKSPASGKNTSSLVANLATGDGGTLYKGIEPLREPSVSRAGARTEAKCSVEDALEQLLTEMGIEVEHRPYWRRQSETLAAWMEIHDFRDVIVPAIRLVLNRAGGRKDAGGKGWRGSKGRLKLPENIHTLRYFDFAIAEVAAVRAAGGRLPGEPARVLRAAQMTPEQWERICQRYKRGLDDCVHRNVAPDQMASWMAWPTEVCPAPGQPGCLCPEEFLGRHGLAGEPVDRAVLLMSDEDWEI
ncbi:MAG: helix-turn-helix domain-containing protein [Alphaproteobacteria bacterium]|nr:helix-turn-helix domain-containing protein [Alphaproteobacteria bacterium]